MAERNQQDGPLLSTGAEGGGAEASEGGGGGSEERNGGGGSGSGEPPPQDLSKNWFSAENTLRVYGEVRVEEV